MPRPRLHIVFPKLPPAHDAIGDHTRLLAEALAAQADVKVLTAMETWTPIPGVEVASAFGITHRRDVAPLADAVSADVPDVLVVQYNPFSYGIWGFNPYLPAVIERLKRRHPAMQVAVIVHEVHPPLLNWRLRLMTQWQRWHFRKLGRSADVLFFTTRYWQDRFGPWFPDARQVHLPVGANLPVVPTDAEAMRAQLGIAPDALVAGVFGTAHVTRLLDFIREAMAALRADHADAELLYVGPHGPALREALHPMPILDAGRLPAPDVSAHFAAMDLCLAPFLGGVSTRRGSFMAAIQHGVPVVTTHGEQTDPVFHERAGEAWLLVGEENPAAYTEEAVRLGRDAVLRQRIGEAGRAFYDAHCDWPVLAEQVLAAVHAPATFTP